MKKLANSVALVTGAGSGIGRELALQLAKAKSRLVLSDINPDNLNETLRQCQNLGAEAIGQVSDVANLEDIQVLHQRIETEFGVLDLLINNAGVAFRGEVANTEYKDYEWVMGVNFWGVVYGCKELMPLLKKSSDAHIVNVSSVFGLMALPTQSAYNASKFAVRAFTESLQQELSNTDINVSCVLPGGIKTNIIGNARASENSDVSTELMEAQKKEFAKSLKTTPEEAARVILDGVKRNRKRILIGSDAIKIDRLVRLLPSLYTKVVELTVSFSEKRLAR
ncbi:SDR family NAD(P)-dependent oxidoreductase [Maricurvus nonylphenolicus]|uniref:SDR family NAD(P)-dependent oxidoreductase n=1 Tax=Maricurvus nonylphenolicus TaxID=1008307 RepID=UPI0036F3669D